MKNTIEKYGSWAVVTGASSGIGKSLTRQLAAEGMNIVAVARNESKLNDLKKEIQGEFKVLVEVLSVDLADPASSDLLAQKTAHLDVGLLVANAGVENDGSFVENDLARETQLLALNINSPMQLSHLFAKRFISKGKGGILLVSSLFGYQGVPYFANYSASKAYILSLGEALNVELKPHGVDVTVLSPGLTETAMVEDIGVDFSKIPITRHQPEVVARVGLNALGKKATVVPGIVNKFYAWENRLIPRSWPVKLFGFLIGRAQVGAKDQMQASI